MNKRPDTHLIHHHDVISQTSRDLQERSLSRLKGVIALIAENFLS